MATDTKQQPEAEVIASVSKDEMAAFIQFKNFEKLHELTRERLMEIIQNKGIKFGIIEESIQIFMSDPLAYAQTPLLIAKGQTPSSGLDGSIVPIFDLNDTKRRPLELNDGRVDYRELNRINNVIEGQMIAERKFATKGTPGTTVTGELVPCKDGREAHFKLGKNVTMDPNNQYLYAAIQGLVALTDNGKINVFPVYEVNGDLDYRIGNIDFIGNVVIRGNVLPGFKIKAAGDIRITGNVESAEIEAGGSIDIAGGIIGAMKGFIKAGIDAKSAFMQEANVTAGHNVIVNRSILHCKVRAGHRVICEGPNGLIVGGVVQAGELIESRTIGNSMSIPTTLEVGAPPSLRLELKELYEKLDLLIKTMEKTDKALVYLNQMALTGSLEKGKEELRSNLVITKNTTMNDIAALQERIVEIETFLNAAINARIQVSGTIHSGIKIVIGSYTFQINHNNKRVTLFFHNGELKIIPNI
jgi:uncharacterized protein (DUF342 family)